VKERARKLADLDEVRGAKGIALDAIEANADALESSGHRSYTHVDLTIDETGRKAEIEITAPPECPPHGGGSARGGIRVVGAARASASSTTRSSSCA
jgi:hypothetical protein